MLLDVELERTQNQSQVQRILHSKTFRTSEVQRNLLSYLAEKSLSGDADSLKEYTVGLDVFAKPASYDPRQESVVRMHVGRLRQKLAEYYRIEGVDDPVVVDLPKGGFKVTFEVRPEEEPAAVPPTANRKIVVALAVGLILAVALAGYFAMRSAGARAIGADTAPVAGAWTPELEQLWGPLLSSSRPLLVCLSVPFDGSSGEQSGAAQASSDWLAGTASGAFLLGKFLGDRKPDVMLTRSDLLSIPEIQMDNVVFIGPATGNRQMEAIPMDQQIVLEAGGIRNLNPRPGEPEFVTDRPPKVPFGIEETHALISHIPGIYGNGEILYLSGNDMSSVMAAVQALTDPTQARALVHALKAETGVMPRYYQVVLKVQSMDDMPVDISYVFHRELAQPEQ